MYSFDQKMHDLNIVLGAGDTVIKKKTKPTLIELTL